MFTLEELGQHTSNVLHSHGIDAPSERKVQIDGGSFSWEEDDELRVSILSDAHALVIEFDPIDHAQNRGMLYSYSTGEVSEVDYANLQAMAGYMLSLLSDT